MGAGESLNGREKNSGEEKSRTSELAPGDKVLTDQFQTVGAALASDWCQKTFVFFLPNHRAARLGVVSCLPTRYIHTRCSPYLSGFVRRGFTRGEKFQSQHKM